MKLHRKVAAIMLFAAVAVGTESGKAPAQQGPPDLRMLMNLDLFEPPSRNEVKGASAPAAAPTDDSMLEQIRTLDAMGYLGNHGGADGNGAPAPRATFGSAPAETVGAPAPAAASEPAPSSQPSYDVEGPQP